MSVVLDRRILACFSFLTAWSDCSFLYLAWVPFDLYSWAVFTGFLDLGWLAAPLTHLLFSLWPCFRETPILAGGLVSLAWWLGLFFRFYFVLNNCESVLLLVKRLG